MDFAILDLQLNTFENIESSNLTSSLSLFLSGKDVDL
ncbi:hypothetical protein SAMN04488577_0967 [Bacillus sp. cl95]|nr:hypothetical protein SAMN02799634_101692 [Bacillus sp. UNCCL13]SFQ67630.1 hypothetical protein SAMN04488577_0967 [Bacillus sp. cl95]